LQQPEIAAVVVQSLHHFHGKSYELLSYCLMPNHVHMVVLLPDGAPPLVRTLQRLKGYTALQANKLLGRTGAFWQAESYDHVVRAGELERIISYIVDNPVKAGLVDDWQQWPFTYVARTL
jgi:putative transposase